MVTRIIVKSEGYVGRYVLVQREMENGRSPLAGIPPSSAGQPGEHRATQVVTGELGGELKLQLVSRKEKHVVWSASHSPRGWKNKLARKENSDCPNAHTPRQATSVLLLSKMRVYRPECRICSTSELADNWTEAPQPPRWGLSASSDHSRVFQRQVDPNSPGPVGTSF